MLINHGLINNFSSFARFGPKLWNAFPEICALYLGGLSTKKIHALLLNLLYSEDASPSKQTVFATLIEGL